MWKPENIGNVGVFLAMLGRQMVVWKRRTAGHRGARRHARDLRRRWVRAYKRKTGATRLPEVARVQNAGELWTRPDIGDALLVLLPARDRTNGPSGRKGARALLYETTPDRLGIDLINAANSGSTPIPAVAEAQFGNFTHMRGIYLSALDAVILPALPAETITNLEQAGAVVLENEVVAHIAPTEEAQAVGEIDRWHLDAIAIEAARMKSLTGKGVSIGFLDTGIDLDHPEFAGRDIAFEDFAPDGSRKPKDKARDYDSHGTHVAAISAGHNTGVAPDARIAMASVLNTRDSLGRIIGYRNQIAAGLNWLAVEALARGEGVDIVNASLGQGFHPGDYQSTKAHVDGGTLLVAAIGNNGRKGKGNHSAPGMYDCALAVGAIDRQQTIADFSDWGEARPSSPAPAFKPDLVAPGVKVYSALPGGRYGLKSGTSMACPIVAGAAALLIEQDESLRGEPIGLTRRLLELTASLPPGPHNEPPRGGRGRLHLASI